MFKKNLNASKPSEHPPQVEQCLEVYVGTLAVEANLFMVSKGFPNVTTSGRQSDNIGEKPSITLYTYINLHAGTPKPHFF